MKKAATFSKDRKYRYTLSRIWNTDKPLIMYIGLNPSIADQNIDDPTIRRLIGFTGSFGAGGFFICNLYAFITPYPENLFKDRDPVGPDNDEMIKITAGYVDKVVCCWGANAQSGRTAEVMRLLPPPLLCFGETKEGFPRHPLYLKKDTTLREYTCGFKNVVNKFPINHPPSLSSAFKTLEN